MGFPATCTVGSKVTSGITAAADAAGLMVTVATTECAMDPCVCWSDSAGGVHQWTVYISGLVVDARGGEETGTCMLHAYW